MNNINLCAHCGERRQATTNTKQFCQYCNTPEKRADMDKFNIELWLKQGKTFVCNHCNKK